jgi:hypothetical protein
MNDSTTNSGQLALPSHDVASDVPLGIYLTPPELAKLWRCKAETILGFIKSGELEAVNLARKSAKRPRWRISPDAIRAFEHGRAAGERPAHVARRRRQPPGIIPFF